MKAGEALALTDEQRRRAKAIFSGIDKDLLRRFKAFHEKNPAIYEQFRDLAVQMKNRRARYSAWVIVNVIRWSADLRSSGDPFKINNDFIALYARLLIYHRPEFSGFFELRAMKPKDRKVSRKEAAMRAGDDCELDA